MGVVAILKCAGIDCAVCKRFPWLKREASVKTSFCHPAGGNPFAKHIWLKDFSNDIMGSVTSFRFYSIQHIHFVNYCSYQCQLLSTLLINRSMAFVMVGKQLTYVCAVSLGSSVSSTPLGYLSCGWQAEVYDGQFFPILNFYKLSREQKVLASARSLLILTSPAVRQKVLTIWSRLGFLGSACVQGKSYWVTG